LANPTVSSEYEHYRRNFACLTGDWVAFITGTAFTSYSTVIPSFVNQLTNFAPLIGLAATIPNGVWLLPQLIAANYVSGRQRKKPWVIVMSLIGRPMYLAPAVFIFTFGNRHLSVLLTIFFFALGFFYLLDGLGSVAWFDIVGNVIPPKRRGRFYTSAQVLTGLFSMGAGALVARVLGPHGPPFPWNYGLLFIFCSTLLLVSLAFFSFVKEPLQDVHRQREPWRAYLPRLAGLLRTDREFRLLNLVRLLAALGGLGLPFYVIHATDILGVGNENIGLFVSAQVLGGIIASLAMGYLNERSGSRIVSQFTVILGLSCPLLALVLHCFPPPQAIVAYVYALVFVLIGGNYVGYTQGFMNLVLEIAPPDQRPTYVGLYNTLGGTLVTIVPVLGGWLLQSTSYPVLFSVAAIGAFAGLVVSLRLREPRRRQLP
jgi:MFS family permease